MKYRKPHDIPDMTFYAIMKAHVFGKRLHEIGIPMNCPAAEFSHEALDQGLVLVIDKRRSEHIYSVHTGSLLRLRRRIQSQSMTPSSSKSTAA